MEPAFLDAVGFSRFEIRPSDDSGPTTALVLPDIGICSDCLHEIFDPEDRRYRYPFTNCTNCGPRYSIIESLPYDRPNTTMKRFTMCDRCRAEYENPLDRRFHAQPNACPECGPHLGLWCGDGEPLASGYEALLEAASAIRCGLIVAVKGLGGFHLMVDARKDGAVRRLRWRKRREEKPFALMFPAMEGIERECSVSALEERLLLSPESPIVILDRIRKGASAISLDVAPASPSLGIMLPYTPLHHILMAELGFPVVATSGNLSDEPICTDETEAVTRLGDIADFLLVHDRPIRRHVDDSIVRVMMDREMVLRRARGYAPLPMRLARDKAPVLAVGAHLKNAVACAVDGNAFISQHIGDLETDQAFNAFERVIDDFQHLYRFKPEVIACDLHPGYLSTQFAVGSTGQPVAVQHHYAHVMSCMTENEIEPPVLGVSWDGTGFGLDGTIWGGEFLVVRDTTSDNCDAPFVRAGHLRTFRLPGGERAVREPRRIAVGLLYELFGEDLFKMRGLAPLHAFSDQELGTIAVMLGRGVNCPVTSSAGRLFDAVASIAGLRQRTAFEGQAAMMLEAAIGEVKTGKCYELPASRPVPCGSTILDWGPMARAIIKDVRSGTHPAIISAIFHNTLVRAIVKMALRTGEEKVVLTGGCFQNRYLTENTIHCLRTAGFRPYWHQRVPPNDGGIALGQAAAANRMAGKD
jgi:hydrogenase maturation protein HypF